MFGIYLSFLTTVGLLLLTTKYKGNLNVLLINSSKYLIRISNFTTRRGYSSEGQLPIKGVFIASLDKYIIKKLLSTLESPWGGHPRLLNIHINFCYIFIQGSRSPAEVETKPINFHNFFK